MSIEQCKLVAVGDGAVGKTSMLVSYTSNSTPTEYTPTVFDNYNAITMLKDKPVSVCCWDTAGQEDYDHLRPLSYPQTDVFIVCFSLTSQTSLANVYIKWVPELKRHCPDVPIILVGTKLDLRNNSNHFAGMNRYGMEMVTNQQGKALADKIGAISYVECSAITQENLKMVFDKALLAWNDYKTQRRKKQHPRECCNIM